MFYDKLYFTHIIMPRNAFFGYFLPSFQMTYISNLYGRNPKGLLPTFPLFHTFCEASEVSPLVKQSAGNTPVVLI